MKIAKTNLPGFDCFVIMSDGLLTKEQKVEVEQKIFDRYGPHTIYNISSRPGEGAIWTTNRHGLQEDRHDAYQTIDFEFVLFKEPAYYI